jgi:hypothetical protein
VWIYIYSLGQLIKIVRESQMEFVVDKLIDFTGGKDEELRDISSLGSSLVFSCHSRTLTLHQSTSLEDHHCGITSGWENRGNGMRQTDTKTSYTGSKCMPFTLFLENDQ